MVPTLKEFIDFRGTPVKDTWGRRYSADVFRVNPDFPYARFAKNRHIRIPGNLIPAAKVTEAVFKAIEKKFGGKDVFADTTVSTKPETENWLQRVSVYGAIALNQAVLEPRGLRIATPWEVQEILAAGVLPVPEEIVFLHSLLLDATVKPREHVGHWPYPHVSDHAPSLLSAIFRELDESENARRMMARLFLTKELHGLMVRIDRIAEIKRATRGRSPNDTERFASIYELVTRPLSSQQIKEIDEASAYLGAVLEYLRLSSADLLLQRISLPLSALRLTVDPTTKSGLGIELAQGWFCDADNEHTVNADVARRLRIPKTSYERLPLQAVDINLHKKGSYQNGTNVPTNAPYSRGLIVVEK